MPALKRHADDLLVFLQQLMACVSAEQWVPFSLALIEAYNDPGVSIETPPLHSRACRTNCLSRPKASGVNASDFLRRSTPRNCGGHVAAVLELR
jgi:hypothetical protein